MPNWQSCRLTCGRDSRGSPEVIAWAGLPNVRSCTFDTPEGRCGRFVSRGRPGRPGRSR